MKSSKTRTMMFLITILTVLAISAIWTLPAFADDVTPPPVPTSEPVVPPEEIPPLEVPPPSDTTVADALAQIPEGTEVVVVNADGENIPLATAEAADAIITGDPVWCPAGVAPQDGTGGCTDSYTTLYELTNDIANGTITAPGANGVIWIKFGADTSANPIVIDGSDADLNTWENFSLTLKGGWNGTFGSTVTNTATPSTFTQSISIINWLGDITLSDITISGVTVGSALNSAALDIETTKKITLTNVNVNNNTGAGTVHGAWLDNDDVGTISDVLVTSSKFNNNKDYGLIIYSKGAITLSSVITDGNGATGTFLDNSGAASAKNVTLTSGQYEFNNNLGWGLTIYSKGSITLKDITANGNGQTGAYLVNTSATTAQPVTFTGTNIFSDNSGSGLFVQSNGAIKTNNVIANSNGTFEAVYLDNDGAATAQPVTMTGTNEFKFNDEGLRVFSKGAITLNNVTANNNNSGDGVYLNNTSSGHLTPQNVTLTGYGIFNNNAFDGLDINTYGAILLTNISTTNNGGYGANLNNYGDGTLAFADGYATLPKSVTLNVSATNPDNIFNNNFGGGLVINSMGAITISGADISNNTNGNGATLNNNHPGAVGGITISGWGAGFGGNGGYGLNATSLGAITATGLWAWGNTLYGATLDNSTGTGVVTITGSTSYGNNSTDGLIVYSKHAITLNNLSVNNNGGYGAFLNNNFPGAVGGITLNGNTDSHNNIGSGLKVESLGVVILNNVQSSDNGGFGLYVDNSSGTGGITLNGNNGFWNNGNSGLELYSKGNILLNNIDTRNNGTLQVTHTGYGAYIWNNYLGAVGNVTVNGYGSFHENFSSGLEVYSNGLVTLTNVYAANNGGDNFLDPIYGYGVYVDNTSAITPKNVSLLGVSNDFYNNHSGGVRILTKGAVTLTKVTANDNPFGDGVFVDNRTFGNPLAPQAVTLNGYGEFHNNGANGLTVSTYGAITMTNTNASDNGDYGAHLINVTGSLPRPVTLNGTNNFNNNGWDGLSIQSLGIIKINDFNANNNTGSGAFLDNNDGSTPSAIMITGAVYTQDNGGYGLQVTSKGAITINVIDAWIGNNGGYGWNLDNHFSGAVGGVTSSSVNSDWAFDFYNNTGYGLLVQSLGSITVAGLDSNNNHGAGAFGAELNNAFLGSTGTVTVTTTGRNDFSGNTANGLNIFSNRTITINNLYAESNGGAGVWLNNSSSGVASPQNVIVNGAREFYNNGDTGLIVDTYGAITLNNISANDNGQNGGAFGWGAWLDNCGYNLGSCDAITPKAITLNGTNNFHGNHQDGLWATSLGAIKVNAPSANSNDADGIYLDNQWTGAVGGITITSANAISINQFNNNVALGLDIYSHGLVTLSSIWANGNIGGGASINTLGATIPQNVVMTGRNVFNYNGDGIADTAVGLLVNADGLITINNLTAIGNDGTGATLDNCLYNGSSCDGSGKVTLTGVNQFSNNFTAGLVAESLGNIDITKVTADNNGGMGLNGYSRGGSITISCGSMTNNGTYGWQLNALSIITLKGVFAFGNGNPANTNLLGGTLVPVRTCPLP